MARRRRGRREGPGARATSGAADDEVSRRCLARHAILRFTVLFAVLMGVFSGLMLTPWVRLGLWPRYLAINADASGAILRICGYDVTVMGNMLVSSRASLQSAAGCDALHPAGMLVCGILAYPTSMLTKLPGVLIGTSLLLSINLVRIISLFIVQASLPQAFEFMHIDVWQALFIFLAIAFWALWVRRVETLRVAASHADA